MLNFLPGQPNNTVQTLCHKTWNKLAILAYCSGNNLIILSNEFTRLQTIYFDEDATAVDINEENGHISVAIGSCAHMFKPLYHCMKEPRWVPYTRIYHDDSRLNCLKWGSDSELVLGSNYLSLWKIKEQAGSYSPHLLWNQKHPTPIYNCVVSDDSQFIATIGKYDSKVKVWRRVSDSGDHALFDLTLIPHAGYVTMFRWRGRHKKTPHSCHILYTLCSDSKFRIWSNYELENKNNVQHWGTVQLDEEAGERFALVIDSCLLEQTMPKQYSTSFLKYLGRNRPELVGIISKYGKMRVLALENLSHDPPKLVALNDIATIKLKASWFVPNPEFLYFAEPKVYSKSNHQISVIIHDLKGSIKHLLITVDKLFDYYSMKNIIEHKFTGHNKSIQKLLRSSDGEAVLTISRFHENSIWVPQAMHAGVSLERRKIINTPAPVRTALVHEKGSFVITLLNSFKLQSWDCTCSKTKVAKLGYEISISRDHGYPLLITNIPKKKHKKNRHFIALIYDTGHIDSYLVTSNSIVPVETIATCIEQEGKIYLASTIDPVQHSFVSDRNLISSISTSGKIRTYKATVSENGFLVEWKLTYEFDTNIENSTLISASSIDKICVVGQSRKEITIWDLRRSVLEYTQTFEDEIRDIDWTSTKMGQSIVSIGFSNHVILVSQLRYDYTNKLPSFLPIKKIDITKNTTHEVGDSTWMKDGTFVIASGNQLFIEDKQLDLSDKFTHQSIGSRRIISNDILHLTSVLNGPLHVYHPQFLIQALYCKKLNLVRDIILRLFHKVREIEFNPDIADRLPSTLDIESWKFLLPSDRDYTFHQYDEPYNSYSEKISQSLREKLTKIALPYLTRHQQSTLLTVLEAFEEIDQNENIIDINGLRFLLGVKLFLSHKLTQESITMRDVSWALHSENKELLLSLIDSELNSWSRMREYKVAYWCKQEDLERMFESIAKFEFTMGGKRDPQSCSIFILALKKKIKLLNLWKLAVGHEEQSKLLNFLKNDFSQPRWKTAALKNAFVLQSKHRYLDSVSFFLLAGSLKDAVTVLVKKVDDLDLAIGVCRLYEGDNGPELSNLLQNYVLPKAISENDWWTISFVFWKIKKRELAIKSLLGSCKEASINFWTSGKDKPTNKSFLAVDPALLQLYAQLRRKNDSYFKASLEINETIEYDIVNKVANIYFRMGCDYLSLSLISNWEFIEEKKSNSLRGSDNIPSLNSSFQVDILHPVSAEKTIGSHSNLSDNSDPAMYSSLYVGTSTTKSILGEFTNPDPSLLRTDIANSGMPRTEFTPTDSQNGLGSNDLDNFKAQSLGSQNAGFSSKEPERPVKVRNLLDDFM
ncbi:Rav1p Ecym_1367 [Eremothecium cymbalariae DBVPG|uniref:RAVE complex protein Rav1 C-terminal domain-containing protein n=1 Tax=Eremothecium cymbalariae (strain CBS 270.75 / DBVPG 7215 / KCTC 17166 / NRRL Y-17582) TaxID=931890 RepID=G8JND6_ERECY|nr:hypothetical protein Ecym_1367 [Eremothecium cymbalariae DBVPG\